MDLVKFTKIEEGKEEEKKKEEVITGQDQIKKTVTNVVLKNGSGYVGSSSWNPKCGVPWNYNDEHQQKKKDDNNDCCNGCGPCVGWHCGDCDCGDSDCDCGDCDCGGCDCGGGDCGGDCAGCV